MKTALQAALAIGLTFLSCPALAATDSGQLQYQRCLDMAASAPPRAVSQALVWRQSGGGAPAAHCLAVAMFNDGQYAEAAGRFDDLADEIETGRAQMPLKGASGPVLAARLRDQAGEAWLLAGQPDKARDAWERALAMKGLEAAGVKFAAQLHIGHARALVAQGHYADAIAELNTAEAQDPGQPDIYLYRASARRLYGDLDAAEADIAKAAQIQPNDPDTILERGNIAHAQGDSLAAAADWADVVKTAPDSDAADAARNNPNGKEPEATY